VVLGPAVDGGYYLLGIKAPHARLFEDIAWSTECVAEETRERARQSGLDLVELASWYDVDDGPSLRRLLQALSEGERERGLSPYAAPATAAGIERLGLGALLGANDELRDSPRAGGASLQEQSLRPLMHSGRHI
jgi:hypothetical protein